MDEMTNRMLEVVSKAPWYVHIGMKPRIEGDRIVIELEVERGKHFQALGMCHGGVIASVLDSSIGLNINSKLIPQGKSAITAQLNIHYIKPTFEGKIKGTGKPIHIGSKTAVGYGEVVNDSGEVLAAGTATFIIMDRRPPERGK